MIANIKNNTCESKLKNKIPDLMPNEFLSELMKSNFFGFKNNIKKDIKVNSDVIEELANIKDALQDIQELQNDLQYTTSKIEDKIENITIAIRRIFRD